MKPKNKELNWKKCQEERDRLARELYINKNRPVLTDDEWILYKKIFNFVFKIGQFSMINMILNNNIFLKDEKNYE